MDDRLLDIQHLTISHQHIPAVNDISFHIQRGEILGVVGESGCGKSLTALSLMGLLPKNMQVSGNMSYQGRNLLENTSREWQQLRGNRLAMIFQEPMTALNPVLTIGEQIAEMYRLHQKASVAEAKLHALEMLSKVHIPDPQRRYDSYPHQLSGGMRQRVMIAMALACQPELIIADEPTTALDVTVQAQVLDLLEELRETTGTAIQLISHNLGIVSQIADRVLVMYAGRMVEQGGVTQIFNEPQHPYTQGLLATLPRIGMSQQRLPAIEGNVPPLAMRGRGCPFADRCSQVQPDCRNEMPKMKAITNSHAVACFAVEERA